MRSFRTIKIDGITDSMLRKSKLLDKRSTSIDIHTPIQPSQGIYYLGMRLTDKTSMPDIYTRAAGTETTQGDETTLNTRANGISTLSSKYLNTENLKPLRTGRTPSLDFGPFSNAKGSFLSKPGYTNLHKKSLSHLTNDLLDTSAGYKLIQKRTGNTVPLSKSKLYREPEPAIKPIIRPGRRLQPLASLSTPKLENPQLMLENHLREELNDIVRNPEVLKRYRKKTSEADFIEKQIHFKKIINEKDNVISQKIRQLNDKFKDARQKLYQLKNRIIEGPLTRIEL